MKSLRYHHAKRAGSQALNIAAAAEEFNFNKPTVDVARDLIGTLLVRRIPEDRPDAGETIVARIVETEAYLPLVDPSCHAYRGPTRRNASVFGRPGHAYVYFIYGNHYCLNVTTEPPGIGAAVLIRAAEPVAGIEAMRRRRPGIPDAALCSGPGNLCRALDIDRRDDGADLRQGNLHIVRQRGAKEPPIAVTPRIGLAVAATWPLRFIDAASNSISPFRRRAKGTTQITLR